MAIKQNFNDAARSGKTETLEQVLTCIQRMQTEWYILMREHWDWLVVLQCMQDHNLFTSHPQRMPLTEFEAWLRTHNVPQLLAHCSKRTMSYANDAIHGARYPWNDVDWNYAVLERWRFLYRTLDSMLQNVTNVTK